jgi:hypothetical protein
MAPNFNPYHAVYTKYASNFKLKSIKQLDKLVQDLDESVKRFRDSVFIDMFDSDTDGDD